MKILVTGFSGFVAGSILSQAPANWDIHGIGRSEIPKNTGNVHYHRGDIGDQQAMIHILNSARPDVVIHTAAIANIDFCENNRAIAETVNYEATKNLASFCNEIQAKLIFCSTDTVFDGQQGFYSEEDQPHPINYYADTKTRAEKIVAGSNPRNVVARLALVMGLPVVGRGNSFLSDIAEKLEKAEPLRFAVNETRTPIDVLTLGAALLELADSSFEGIIHLAGNTRINRYEMAKQIARFAGFSDDQIIPINSNELPGRAPRPDDASLNNLRARSVLKTPMLTFEKGLARFPVLKKK